MKDFYIRPYIEGDEIKINDGFNQVFGENRTLEEWKWKFQSNNESRILLAFDSDDNLISHYAVLIDKFNYKGILYTSGHSVDTFSKPMPTAIRTKLFKKLVLRFFEMYGNINNVSLMYGFPGTRMLKLGSLKLDYGEAFPIKLWKKSIPDGSDYGLVFKSFWKLRDKKIDHLWNRSVHRYPVSIVKDAAWVNKRYLSRPNGSYQVLRTARIGAYTSLCIYIILKDTLFLVDLIWDGMRKKDLVRLESLLVNVSREKRLSYMAMWLSGDKEAESVFESNNWQIETEPQNLHMVVKSFNSDIDRSTLLNHFYLTKGCTDII